MLKQALTAAALTVALCVCGGYALPSETCAAGKTMADYTELRGSTALSKLDVVDLAEARRTAPELKEIGDWYRRVGYYLGDKGYAVTTGWTPQKVQLVTPYSLTKYINYEAYNNLESADDALLGEVAALKDVAWVWVWSNGSYSVFSSDQPAPTVEDVVIRTADGALYNYLDKEQYIPVNAVAKAKVAKGQLWPFPAKLFSGRNIPFEIIVVDSYGNKKPLKIGTEDLAKCK